MAKTPRDPELGRVAYLYACDVAWPEFWSDLVNAWRSGYHPDLVQDLRLIVQSVSRSVPIQAWMGKYNPDAEAWLVDFVNATLKLWDDHPELVDKHPPQFMLTFPPILPTDTNYDLRNLRRLQEAEKMLRAIPEPSESLVQAATKLVLFHIRQWEKKQPFHKRPTEGKVAKKIQLSGIQRSTDSRVRDRVKKTKSRFATLIKSQSPFE